MWNQTSKDFDEIFYSQQTELTTTFIYDGEESVVDFSPSCLCLVTTRVGNLLHVVWKLKKPNDIGYASRKYITVHFNNGDTDELKLTAIIKP